MDDIAPMLVAITLILTAGGVAILRPLTKRVGELLEIMAKEKRQPRQAPPETQRMVELMESMHTRLERLEERQDFTDSLLAPGRDGRTLPRARSESPERTV